MLSPGNVFALDCTILGTRVGYVKWVIAWYCSFFQPFPVTLTLVFLIFYFFENPSSDPESTFGRVSCSPATLQWADSASPLDLQSESELSGTKSSSVIDAGPGVNEKVDVFDLEMEFVPINAPLSIPCGGIGQNTTFIEAEFQPATSFESRLPNNHVQAELQSDPHSGAQANSSDCLDDAKVLAPVTVLVILFIYLLVSGQHIGGGYHLFSPRVDVYES